MATAPTMEIPSAAIIAPIRFAPCAHTTMAAAQAVPDRPSSRREAVMTLAAFPVSRRASSGRARTATAGVLAAPTYLRG